MKKYLMILLCLAMTAVACKKTDPVTPSDPTSPTVTVDNWVGNYDGNANFTGTIYDEITFGIFPPQSDSTTFTNTPIDGLTMTITKVLVNSATLKINIPGLQAPIVIPAIINGSEAAISDIHLADIPLPFTIDEITIPLNVTLDIKNIKANYDNGKVTLTCDFVGNGTTTTEVLGQEATIGLTFDMAATANFNKKTE